MLTQQTYPSVTQYTERQNKAVHRILESLEKREERLGEHYQAYRVHSRQNCHRVIEISVEALGGEKVTFTVYMGDVSPSGMSFLFPYELPSPDIIIAIPLNEKDKTLFRGEIVRMKEIPDEEFFEYGVKFNGRLL